jgi:hypothetical protein
MNAMRPTWSNLPHGQSFWARDEFSAYWARGLRAAALIRAGMLFQPARGDGPT